MSLTYKYDRLRNWAGADELVFQQDHDAEHPQGNFHAGNCKRGLRM